MADAAKNLIVGKLFWTRVGQYKFLRMRSGYIWSQRANCITGAIRRTNIGPAYGLLEAGSPRLFEDLSVSI